MTYFQIYMKKYLNFLSYTRWYQLILKKFKISTKLCLEVCSKSVIALFLFLSIESSIFLRNIWYLIFNIMFKNINIWVLPLRKSRLCENSLGCVICSYLWGFNLTIWNHFNSRKYYQTKMSAVNVTSTNFAIQHHLTDNYFYHGLFNRHL